MKNVVLCGGTSRSLWPLSVGGVPQQFLKLGMSDSLYIETIKRNLSICSETIVITDQKYAEAADSQIMQAKIPAEIIMEPSGKGTAASIAIACMMYPDSLFLITPSDLSIEDENSYVSAVKDAEKLALEDYVVLFGVEADKPEKRYGYVKPDGSSFIEKPDQKKAEELVKDGYLINSGIICAKSDVLLHELLRFIPDQMVIARVVHENVRSGRATHRLCGRFMGEMKNISIENAVLENTDKLKCIQGIKGWRDVGTFSSYYDYKTGGDGKNISLSIGDSFGCADFVESSCSMIINKDSDVVVCGLRDVVVVETNGKILVTSKDADISEVMKKLEE